MKLLLVILFYISMIWSVRYTPVYTSVLPPVEEPAVEVRDAVCNKMIDTHAIYKVRFFFDDIDYYFCDEECLIEFNNNTPKYLKIRSIAMDNNGQ